MHETNNWMGDKSGNTLSSYFSHLSFATDAIKAIATNSEDNSHNRRDGRAEEKANDTTFETIDIFNV